MVLVSIQTGGGHALEVFSSRAPIRFCFGHSSLNLTAWSSEVR
jgi:hypothetical protein